MHNPDAVRLGDGHWLKSSRSDRAISMRGIDTGHALNTAARLRRDLPL
jgi:hypothetical protein